MGAYFLSMPLNVEIKARCDDIRAVRTILEYEGADYRGLDHQVDTYFRVPRGRLKLREGRLENALVFYEREDKEGPKDSRVILYQSQPDPNLKEALKAACGVLVVVDKLRHIYFIENVKFHVDAVQDLGKFCEIEAIDSSGKIGKAKLLKQCRHYMKVLGIKDEDLVSCSYSDLLLQKLKK